MKKVLIASLLLSAAPAAFAARPFVTDDARLTNAGSCQLESWARFYEHSRELWALPACNPTGNLEFTAGGGIATNDARRTTEDYVLQLKTLFRALETSGWGWGLGLGTVRHPKINPGPNLLGNTYAYVPVSFSFNDDKLVVHTNVGLLRDRASGENNMTWGVGGEFQATPQLLLIAETFGDHRNQPYLQVGGRYAIRPNLVQVDTTIGQQLSGPASSRWISIGLRLTPERLF